MSPPNLNPSIPKAGRGGGKKQKGLFQGNPLRIACFSGLILSVLIGGSLVVAYFLNPGAKTDETDEGFYRSLRKFDQSVQAAQPEIEKLDRELDRLEKKAEGVESWLSILKRRRQLARLSPGYIPAFRESARRARRTYPMSEPLAALAAAALIQDTAITKEGETELRDYLPRLSDRRFSALRLSIHVLLGDMKECERASEFLPPGITVAELGGSLSAFEKEAVAGDLAMLKLLKGDSPGAAAEIQSVLAAYPLSRQESQIEGSAPSAPAEAGDTFLRFAAEYFFDFGDILRSAELFSRLPDEAALLRQADALWLGGYAGSARIIWSMVPTSRALYNLAITTENTEEKAALLERLVPSGDGGAGYMGDLSRLFGLIHYSRLLEAPRAIAILEAGRKAVGDIQETDPSTRALIELEILRRQTWEIGRLTAETWLLLSRYPEDEKLYRWGAWFFDFQRNYSETAALLKTAARHQFSGQWIRLHEALRLAREGNLDGAETIFASIPADDAALWPAAANLGRILEARHAPARALEYYEIAAGAVSSRKSASQIQFRIAHCLKTLGRPAESRRVLEYSLDLNPDNLNARLELEHLGR